MAAVGGSGKTIRRGGRGVLLMVDACVHTAPDTPATDAGSNSHQGAVMDRLTRQLNQCATRI